MPSNDPFYASLGQALRIGSELVAGLVVGGGLGYAADTYFQTRPVFMAIGVFIGMSAGILNVIRTFSSK
jgi:ATP synthase protein I